MGTNSLAGLQGKSKRSSLERYFYFEKMIADKNDSVPIRGHYKPFLLCLFREPEKFFSI